MKVYEKLLPDLELTSSGESLTSYKMLIRLFNALYSNFVRLLGLWRSTLSYFVALLVKYCQNYPRGS